MFVSIIIITSVEFSKIPEIEQKRDHKRLHLCEQKGNIFLIRINANKSVTFPRTQPDQSFIRSMMFFPLPLGLSQDDHAYGSSTRTNKICSRDAWTVRAKEPVKWIQHKNTAKPRADSPTFHCSFSCHAYSPCYWTQTKSLQATLWSQRNVLQIRLLI